MPDGRITDTRDGVTWFNDRLDDVASRAAVELDNIQLGRGDGKDWHIRALATWLARVADESLVDGMFAELVLSRVSAEPVQTRAEARAFARELSDALSQSIWFDPTINGWKRDDLRGLLVRLSRAAASDPHYAKGRRGEWRGVHW